MTGVDQVDRRRADLLSGRNENDEAKNVRYALPTGSEVEVTIASNKIEYRPHPSRWLRLGARVSNRHGSRADGRSENERDQPSDRPTSHAHDKLPLPMCLGRTHTSTLPGILRQPGVR